MMSSSKHLVAGFVVMLLSVAFVQELQAAPDAEALAAGRRLGEMKRNTPPAEVYRLWNRFCKAHFGAEKEPLVYDFFGRDLKMLEGGAWRHVSETSACIAWETNLPATTRVEYGRTRAYGMKSPEPERPFYIHVHYLKSLKPLTTYHYRLVSVDERGKRVVSKDGTFTTKRLAGAIHIPGDLAGPPYVLDKPNTTYLLTKDVTTSGTAIEVRADGITLDLDGHTITYHNKTVPKDIFTDKWLSYVYKGVFGIKNMGGSDFTLLNGTVSQGAGTNHGNKESTGFNPVYLRSCSRVLVAGLTVDYHSPQTTGLQAYAPRDDYDVHHNVLIDRGCVIRNRHGGVMAVGFRGSGAKNHHVHHNLVKRTRQGGLATGANETNHNEVYVDSWSVNSFGANISSVSGEARHNRIFGTGVNTWTCAWGRRDTRVYHNLIHFQGIDTGKNRGKEGWGDQDSMNGLRGTNYGKGGQERENLLYRDNLIVIKSRGGSQARGTEFFSDETVKDLVCRDSVIKVEVEDDRTSQVACVVTHGQAAKAATCLPVWYRNCTLISNMCNVRMGDYYGKGSNHHFVGCKLVRTGTDPRYHTFMVDGQYWSTRHVLLDCEFGPGTAYNDVLWKRTSAKSFYSVKWTLTVRTSPGAKVSIKDKSGAVAFEGTVSAVGAVRVPLTQCVVRPPKRLRCPSTERVEDVKTPHTVTVEIAGRTKTIDVEMTKKRAITVMP